MNFKKSLAVVAVLACIFAILASCTLPGGSDGVDGTYHVSQGYADFTFEIDGESITCVYTDTYYNNTSTHQGTLTEVDDEDDDDSTAKYTVVWVDTGSGMLGFRELYYNAKDKTITAPGDFNTYVLEKQK
ncbi:MAG: hypothetical protein IJD95_05965 [Clostridia bacterium]|nr:hypothetical protein [Clostridia bacterium]MBR2328036.1 hypothetical protein [Clostridia bacterium]